jgi:predicted enzyme related to lactoylglutathione lyase
MSERDDYMTGVPCWVDTYQPDPATASRFYAEVLGWEFEGPDVLTNTITSGYLVARFRGREVAAIGASSPNAASQGAAWNSYVAVDSLEESLERATGAGGSIVVGPVDMSPAQRWGAIADPSGAVIGLLEQGARRGAQLVNASGAWALSQLHTDDLDRAQAFYGSVFGWQNESFPIGDGEMIACRLPGYLGGVAEQPVPRDVVAILAPAPDGTEPYWRVRFWTDDVDAAATTAAALGGEIVEAPRDVHGSRMAVLADPAGAQFTVDTPAGDA